MSTNKKQNLMTKELLKTTVELRKKMENHQEYISYKKDLIKILTDIEKKLTNEPLDFDKLGKDEFGIFRLVTDSSRLEHSAIGKELMSLLGELYIFRQAIKEVSTTND